MKKLKVIVVTIAVALTLGTVTLSATEVEAASGSVTSYAGTSPVVGVWIQVKNGKSGWAWLSTNRAQRATWNYNTQGKEWRAHIGTGGSPQRWARTHYTPWTRKSNNGISLEAYWNPYNNTTWASIK